MRAALRLLAGVALGAALAAVALLPFAELLLHSGDLETREGRPFLTLEPRFLLGFFLPDYWGRPSGAQIDAFLVARAFYVGALPLMLAAWALLRPSRERLAIGRAGRARARGGGRRAGDQADRDGAAGVRHRLQHAPDRASRRWRSRCSPDGGWTT